MPTNKSEEQSAPLRRSSRSTRGSIKPIIDLTKSELSEPEDGEQEKEPKEDKDDVQVLDSDQDEDYGESAIQTKSNSKNRRRSATATGKKQHPAVDTKTPKKGAQKNDPETKPTVNRLAKSSKKPNKPNDQDTITTIDQNDVEICYDLSEKELKEINNAFDMNCSTDGEELLGSDDLKTAIRSLGFEPRADEIQKLLKKFANKTGKINRDSFHKIMAFKMGSSPAINDHVLSDEISRVFNLLDLDKTGMITLDNLRSISKELNEEITDEELHEMIVEADLDGDFQINKQEFYNIMKKTSLY